MAKKTNCVINGIEYYRVRKKIGKKEDGSPKYKNFYGSSKKEADAQAQEFLDNINKGMNDDFKNITIEELTSTWLYDVKYNDSDFKPGSFSKYEGIFRNYIKDSDISYLKVFYTKSINIQKYYNQLSEDGKTFSQIKNLNKVLSGMFEYAIQEGYALKNPCSLKTISIPESKKKKEKFDEVEEEELDFFDTEDLNKIIAECNKRINNKDKDYLPYLILFSLGTGLRQGEALGLQTQYFNNHMIRVRKELAKIKKFKGKKHIGYEYKLVPPKTKNSIRDVDVASYLFDITDNYINTIVKRNYKKNKIQFNNQSLIFVTSICTYIDQSNLRKKWVKFLQDINVPFKKWHALRHGFACLLFLAGADIKTVQELMGHADIKTTSEIYLHVFPEQKKAAINLLNEKLSG